MSDSGSYMTHGMMYQVRLLYEKEFPAGAFWSNKLLNNLKAKTARERQDGLNASAALMRDLQARADRGEIEYVALFSSIINTKDVEKATLQALTDAKSPISTQFVYSSSKTSQAIDYSKRILMGVVWSEKKLLETCARFPELATADTTFKTNKKGRPLFKIQGLDGDGKMFTRANALLWNESEEAFLFVFKIALPRLWGADVCRAMSLIITDGDAQMIYALKSALKTTYFINCTIKRCYWHLVHQTYSKLFGNGETDSATNTIVRRWLNSLAYRVETVADFEESITALKTWISSNVEPSIMPLRKGDVVQISRVERMLQFVSSIEALKKSWAKCYRRGLCDLGHITTALSEAGFAKLKGWNLGVHAQMSLNHTVDTMRKAETHSIARSECNSDRDLTTRPLQNCRQTAAAVSLGEHLTRKAVDEVDRQLKKARKQEYRLVAKDKIHVTYLAPAATDSSAEFPGLCDSDDSDDDKEDDSVLSEQPWPKYAYTREVSIRNGLLYCTCGYTQSMLLPCSHILCVKNLTVSHIDSHFRYALAWQAGRLPLAQLSRTYLDQQWGVSLGGVVDHVINAVEHNCESSVQHYEDDFSSFANYDIFESETDVDATHSRARTPPPATVCRGWCHSDKNREYCLYMHVSSQASLRRSSVMPSLRRRLPLES